MYFQGALAGRELTFNSQIYAIGNKVLVAPKTLGNYPLVVINAADKKQAILHILEIVPANKVDKNGCLNGYRIGHYPIRPLHNNLIYLPPKGFVEVAESNTILNRDGVKTDDLAIMNGSVLSGITRL